MLRVVPSDKVEQDAPKFDHMDALVREGVPGNQPLQPVRSAPAKISKPPMSWRGR